MHEWALAEAVVTSVSEIAEKEGFMKIDEVKLKVGELQRLEQDILEFALSQLKLMKLKGAKFVIEIERAELKCRICENEWPLKKDELEEQVWEIVHFIPELVHCYLRCPKCGSPDFEICRGRGLWIENIRGSR